MGVFDSIGNFFRGAFNGDSEEEKKRKQREAAAKAAAQKPQLGQPKIQNAQQLTTINTDKPITFDKPKPVIQPEVSLQQTTVKQPKLTIGTAPTANQGIKVGDTTVDNNYKAPPQKFRGFSMDEGTNKKLFGMDVGQYMGQFGKTYKVKLDRDTEQTSDNFLKQYSGLNDEFRRVYTDKLIQQAKAGDGTAINTLKVLNDAGKLKGNFNDFIEGANQDFYENTLQRRGSQLIDAVTPGHFGEQYRKDLETRQRQMQNFDAGKLGQEFDPGTVGMDIGLTIAGGAGAAKLATSVGTKIPALAAFLKTGSTAANITSKAIPLLADSIGATATQDAISKIRGRDTSFAQDAATGVGIDVAGHLVMNKLAPVLSPVARFFGKGGKQADNIVSDILKETDPTVIKEALGIDDVLAAALSKETNPEVVKETLQKLSLDPSFKLDPDVQKRLEEEGIVAVKKDPNDPYGASYKDNTITARDQQALDDNVYHEMAHAQWQNKLTPEEKALFKGDGAASQSARGRAGYGQDEINSEDFSDYMNKAMTGKFDEVPDAYKAIISKYARIALSDPATASQAVRTIAESQKRELDAFIKANPDITKEQAQSAVELSKKRALKLITQTEESRASSLAALDTQALKNAQDTTVLQQQAKEAADLRTAQQTPAPVPAVKNPNPVAGSPEVAANDAYDYYRSENPDRYGKGQAELGDGLYLGDKNIAGRLQDGTVVTDGLYGYKINPDAKILDSSSDAFRSIDAQASSMMRNTNLEGREWQRAKAEIMARLIKEQGYDGVKRGTNQLVAMSDNVIASSSPGAPTFGLKPTAPPPVEEPVDAYKAFNDAAGIESGSRDLTYLDAQQQLEKMAGNKTLEELAQRQGFRIPTAINSSTQGAVADVLTDTTGKVTGSAIKSQNPLANFFGQTLFGFNKKSTLTNAEKTLVEQVRGRTGGIGNLRDQIVETASRPLASLDETGQALAKEKVFKAFEEFNNGNMDGSLALIKSFTPEERAYFDNVREMNVLRNNLNRATMDASLIDKFDNGMHMPRIYDMEAFAREFSPDDLESFIQSQNKTLDLNPAKRRKQIDEIAQGLQEQMLRDPAQASAIRTEIALHNKAVSEYAATIGMIPDAVSDVPLKGYLPIPNSPRFGDAQGKYIRRDLAEPMLSGNNKFTSETYKAVNTILDKYQSSIMGKMEQGLRKGLTVYNPATRMGNRGANLAQGAMAGFNLPEMAVSQQHYINVLKNGGDEWTRLAKTFGALDNGDALLKFSGGVNDPQGLFKDFRKGLNDSYQNVDNAAKVSMFKWQIQRGATPEEAARFVNRALPNIGNSGEVYSFFSRLPVLGTPFRAIQPEVLRALSSTMGRNTVPFLVAMATYTTLQNATWKDVPPEERAQIQERFGSGQTPFKGINDFFGSKGIPTDKVLPSSWSFNAAGVPGLENLFAKDPETGNRPVVDVDPRRLMGMYSINLGGDSAADSVVDTALKASPMNIPAAYNNGEWTFQPQNVVASRLFSPLWQAAIDKDFRGKSVQSPERDGVNVVDPVTGQPLDQRDNPGRAAQYLLRSYIPQVNDVANVVDASQGKENFYGQTMNLPQSVARLFGLKGESFDSARIQDMNDTKAYFDDKAVIDKQLEGMTPNEQTAWKRLTGYDKLNEKKPNAFGGESWVKAPVYNFGEDKWKDYAANPRLYDLMVQKKQSDSARDGSPVQPEFDARLSDGFRKQLLQNKMVAPGDDAELDQRMYASPEWDYYQKLKTEYKDAAAKYYGESDGSKVSDELVKHQDAPFPEKPAEYAAYTAAYAQYANGKAAKPEFTDQVKAAKDAYNMETLKWTNTERAARGLPAITWDVWNNPTFGFDTTPSGFGFGFGGGSRGTNTLSELTSFSNDVNGNTARKVEAVDMPQLAALFRALNPGAGGGRAKPKLGASASGR